MIRWVTFGIIVDDIVFPQGDTRMGVLGGGGAQTAWGMATAAGSGEFVGLVAGIGRDLESSVLAPLQAARINLDGLRITDLPTPRAWQVMEYDGRRTQVWRVPSSSLGRQLARQWELLPPAYQAAQAFHWGIHPGEAGFLDLAQALRVRGKTVSLEPFRPPDQPLDDDALRAILAACDVFSPNWHEAQMITGLADHRQVLQRLRTLGGRIVAIRRGEEGAELWDLAAGHGVHVPAVNVPVVDVVGAGNAFCGALLARLDQGLAEAACAASAAASFLVQQVGLPPSPPDPSEMARRQDEVRAGLRLLAWDDLAP